MELKLFTDLIDALGKVAGGLKAIVNHHKVQFPLLKVAARSLKKLHIPNIGLGLPNG